MGTGLSTGASRCRRAPAERAVGRPGGDPVPQGLDYVAAFLGALHAGVIAVPQSIPQFGVHDERVSSALHDPAPVVVLATSAVVDEVAPCVTAAVGRVAPHILEIDALNLDSPIGTEPVRPTHSRPAYLQYTSGSTRLPAGVMVSQLRQSVRTAMRRCSGSTRRCRRPAVRCHVAATKMSQQINTSTSANSIGSIRLALHL